MAATKRPAREFMPEHARAAIMGAAQRFVRRFGYQISQADTYPIDLEERRRARLLGTVGVDVVLDVGGATGEYVMALRKCGYKGRAVSFEPLSSSFTELEQAVAADKRWECRQLALGASDGTAQINVSENSNSSSLLGMRERQLQSAPEARYVGTETIETARLDTIWDDLVREGERPFLKLDVQGFELEALRGAEKSLPKVVGVQTELSLTPLYDDAPTYHDVIAYLEERGFRLAGLEAGHDDVKTGEMLQADGLFIRA